MTNYWITKINTGNTREEKTEMLYSRVNHTVKMAEEIGFRELNYTSFRSLSNNKERRLRLIESQVFSVQAHDVVVVQFPLWAHLNYQMEFIDELKKRFGVKIVALVHEIVPWKNDEYNVDDDFFLNLLRKFDAIITPNNKMSQRLRQDKIDVPIMTMDMWDFLYQGPLQEKEFSKKLYYVAESPVESVKYKGYLPLEIFGTTAEDASVNSAEFIALSDLQDIPVLIDGGFGLVNCEDIIEESAVNDSYTQYDTPLSLSIFLAAGVPVIVTKDSPYAPLVSSRNIGLVVEDMNELDKKMAILTENEYKKMLEAVRPWQEAVSEGFFTKHALVNLTRGMELGYEDVIYKESKQADYSEFIEQLTQKIFYFMHHDNSEKKDYLKFLPDGKIESLDNVSANNWEIGNDKLYILDEYKGLSSIFDIREGFNAMLRGRYLKEDIPALLVETDMEELEFIEVDPDKDKGDLSTFVEKDSEEYKKLKAIAQEGKTVDGYGNGKYVVIPNEKIFYINDMIKDEELGLWYHFEEPRHQDEELCKKLIVYMPTFNAISSTSAHARFFGAGWFGSLGGYAPANTHIMRISENNLISGSYMMDTKNNPNYEEQIQSLIKKVAKQHEIPETNIVLMGNSRGGTIALLHGLIGNYSVMSSDPIVNRGEWLADDKDEQMILDAIPEDFTVRLNKLLKNTKIAKENIKIFTQEKIQITYPYIEKLNQDKFELIKYDSEFFGEDDTMNGRNRHGYFIQNTLPVQRDTVYTILNSFDPKKPEEEMEEK